MNKSKMKNELTYNEIMKVLPAVWCKGTSINNNKYIQCFAPKKFFELFKERKKEVKELGFNLYKDKKRCWVVTIFDNNKYYEKIKDNVYKVLDNYEEVDKWFWNRVFEEILQAYHYPKLEYDYDNGKITIESYEDLELILQDYVDARNEFEFYEALVPFIKIIKEILKE